MLVAWNPRGVDEKRTGAVLRGFNARADQKDLRSFVSIIVRGCTAESFYAKFMAESFSC